MPATRTGRPTIPAPRHATPPTPHDHLAAAVRSALTHAVASHRETVTLGVAYRRHSRHDIQPIRAPGTDTRPEPVYATPLLTHFLRAIALPDDHTAHAAAHRTAHAAAQLARAGLIALWITGPARLHPAATEYRSAQWIHAGMRHATADTVPTVLGHAVDMDGRHYTAHHQPPHPVALSGPFTPPHPAPGVPALLAHAAVLLAAQRTPTP